MGELNPKNEPLAKTQIEKMDDEPAWIDYRYYGFAGKQKREIFRALIRYGNAYSRKRTLVKESYGINWLAYAGKPDDAERHGAE